MDSRCTSFVCILLLSLVVSIVSETSYNVIFNRGDGDMRNTYTLTCQNAIGDALTNAKWFFNSINYTSNPCTQDAVIEMDDLVVTIVPECEGYMQCGTETILSPPRLLLTYPTYIPDFDLTQQTVYLQTGEDIVIPCGVRVSATGNYKVEWRKDAQTLMNVTLDSKYGLILRNIMIDDSGYTYACVVIAVTGGDLDSKPNYNKIQGRSTTLDVTRYTQPRIIKEFEIIRNDNGVKLISLAEASGMAMHQWFKNDIEVRISSNVTIENIPEGSDMFTGTLEFTNLNDLNDGDIIEAVVNNTNVRGEAMNDSDRAVFFTIPPSTIISTTCTSSSSTEGASATVSSTITTSDFTGLFDPDTDPGKTNIILIVIAIFLILIVLSLIPVLIIIIVQKKRNYKHTITEEPNSPDYQNELYIPTCDQHLENDFLEVCVGNRTFKIPKNSICLTDLLENFNDIILSTVKHIKLDDNAKFTIKELRRKINEWEIAAMGRRCQTDGGDIEDTIVQDSASQLELFDLLFPVLNNKLKIDE